MKISTLSVCVVFGIFGVTFATKVNKGKEIFCARANVTEVRIQNCESEPCTIKKGEELPVEVDFIFETPLEAKEVGFSVFVSYWAKYPAFYGSHFASESQCERLKLSSCPPKARVRYTLHANLYVDPESKDTLNEEETGIRRTSWKVNPTRRENDEQSYSVCNFNVELNIVK